MTPASAAGARLTLPRLILELRPLLADFASHWQAIVDLLEAHRTLAEYEVARHYVGRAIGEEVRDLVRSNDPRQRLRGVRMLALTYGRSAAARELRRLVKDPNSRVRAYALRAAGWLEITDVALPDSRAQPARSSPTAAPGWNVEGWSFGLVGEAKRRPPRPLPDAAREARRALPELPDVAAVAALVGVADAESLRRMLRPGSGPGSAYVEFDIPKTSGGVRTLAAPRPALKAIQRVILRDLLEKLPTHEAAHGFVPGRSILTNAGPHVGAALVVKLDLQDFFPSVHYRRVAGLFAQLGYGEEVSALLAGLTTCCPLLPDGRPAWPGVLPQGAPTSPAIANLVCRRLDARLAGLSASVGAVYTRYADDLTFSFREPPSRGVGRFFWWVAAVCQQEGFFENVGKRRVLRPSNQQRVTGLVVNAGVSVPREARRRFRATLANCERDGLASQARGRPDFADYLVGFAGYLAMVHPDQGEDLLRRARALVTGADASP